MTSANIHYELTKQRQSQSMHTRSALASYEILDSFTRSHSYGLVYNNALLNYFIWVDGKEVVESANKLEKKLFSDFGAQKKRLKGIFHRNRHYKEIFEWELDIGKRKEYLEYIDSLGELPNLMPRPPLSIAISADFWLNETEKTETMKSHFIAWLSPASNKVSFTLNFPHSQVDEQFNSYRKSFQANCPVELEDKYFYIMKSTKSGDYSFSKAF